MVETPKLICSQFLLEYNFDLLISFETFELCYISEGCISCFTFKASITNFRFNSNHYNMWDDCLINNLIRRPFCVCKILIHRFHWRKRELTSGVLALAQPSWCSGKSHIHNWPPGWSLSNEILSGNLKNSASFTIPVSSTDTPFLCLYSKQ